MIALWPFCRPLGGTAPDAELVPVRVREHHPLGPVCLAPVIKHDRAQTGRSFNLLVPLRRGWPTGRNGCGSSPSSPPGRAGTAAPADRSRVPRVEGDLMDLQGSTVTVCHDARETTRSTILRNRNSSYPVPIARGRMPGRRLSQFGAFQIDHKFMRYLSLLLRFPLGSNLMPHREACR